MELPSTFRKRLALARNNKGLSQEQLGVAVGSTGALIGRLERGETTSVDIAVLRRLIRHLDVPASWLLAMDVPGEEASAEEDAVTDVEEFVTLRA